MNQLVIFSLVVAFASADVSHLGGYSYQTPSGSYLPGAGSGLEHGGSSSSGSISFAPNIIYEPSGSYLPGEHLGSGSGHGSGGILIGGGSGLDLHGSSGGFDNIFGGGHGHGGIAHGEQTEVHYYGGDDHEQSRLRIHVAPVPSRNRVLFVKSPDAGSTIIPEIVAPAAASVDRTLVYVLSKKQQPVGQINIPASVHNVVKTKPQVYYLRYKDAQDAERAVSESLGGKIVGAGVRPINDRASFVRTLSTESHGGISGVLGAFGGSGSGSSLIGFGSQGVSGGGVSGLGVSGLGVSGLGGSGLGVSGLGVSGLGGSVGGGHGVGSGSGSSSFEVVSGTSGGKYGTPGASGPY